MTGPLKKDFKKSARKGPDMPVISVADGIDDPAYIKLRAPLRRKWARMPLKAQEVLCTEIQRLKTMGPYAHEYAGTIDYLNLVLALSWNKVEHKKISLKKASRKLDATHYGMDKTKEKCIEFIATLNSGGKSGGAICLDGPPGVGKTSIAESIAHAMGRKVVKISMAGVSDQTHLRGHRRTYMGSLPGAVIEGMKKAGTSNPIIILDEGDKAGGASEHGNPTFAMLELLDPGQNATFKDHYLNIEYDLSDVIFIMTTNDVSTLPSPLIDRMEIIPIQAYTSEEKLHIAQKYLIPKHKKECGIEADKLHINQTAIHRLIEEYTNESGVRRLEKYIKDICRKTNVALQRNLAPSAVITAGNIESLMGPPRIFKNKIPSENTVGMTNGLYFSENGGGTIPVQVATRLSDKFNLAVTGMAGQMIQESAKAALETIRHSAERYGIDTKVLDKTSIHVHLLDGASPKDGPSAGIAITTAILSSLMNVKARRDVAMTGEIDLHGNVLPIGGVKEKLEGARKAGATTVLIPWENQYDLYDVPETLKAKLTIIPVKNIDEVLQHALAEKPLNMRPNLAVVPSPDGKTPEPSAEEIERVVRFMAEKPGLLQRTIKLLIPGMPGPS